MSAMSGFICWQERDLSEVFFADAGAHGHRPGVFAATHRPIPAVREAAGVTTAIADAAVDALQHITADAPGTDPVVIPVLGDPGTGKSHLIRWVWTRLERRASDDLVVIYVPRVRTSFAGVVELLLNRALEDNDPEVRTLAQSLVDYSADLAAQDVEAVAAGLKAAMFGILKRRSTSDASHALIRDLQTVIIEGGELVEYFASSESAVGRRALKFVDRSNDDITLDDRGFTAEELEGLNELSRLGPSRPFVDAIRRLVVHKQHGDLDVPARILNWALDQAVAEQTASSGEGRPTLNVVFRRLRESLQRAGKELVILVEDLKLLHGVERALLEILIDPADAIGLEPACRVRALVACTPVPWRDILDDNETLASRLRSWEQPTYTLNVPEDQPREETLAQLDDLAAAYLNAARVGVEVLEHEYDAVPETGRDSWVPPVPCETCQYRQECHAAFGSIRRGDGAAIGLYPFNRASLGRSQDLVQRRTGSSLDRQLNPRVLLTQVLQPVLRSGSSAIPASSFPSPELAERLGVPRSPEVTRRLEAVGYPREDMGRAAAALLLWGDRTGDGQQLLSAEIAAAFSLEVPPGLGSDDVGDDFAEPEPGPTPAPRDTRQQALSEWLNGGPLIQRVANETRQSVLRLTLEVIDWADHAGSAARSEALQRELGVQSAEYTIRIEGAAVGEGSAPAGTTETSFARDEDSYRFFLSALRWPRRSADDELYGSDLIDLAEGLEQTATTVQDAAQTRGLARAQVLSPDEPALRALMTTSVVLGLTGSGASDPVQFLAALLSPTPPVGGEGSGALEKLQALASNGIRRVGSDAFFSEGEPVGREAARQWLMRRVALRQSPQATEGEAVHAIDAARLIPALTVFASTTELPDDDVTTDIEVSGAPSFARLASQVNSRAGDALSSEVDRVASWRKAVAGHVELTDQLDGGESWSGSVRATLEAAIRTLKRLKDDGLVPEGSLYDELLEAVKGLAPAFKDGAATEILGRLALISGWDGSRRSRDLAALVAPRHPEVMNLMRSVASFVDLADRFLIQATNLVTARLSEEDPILAKFDQEFLMTLDRAAAQLELS